MTAVYDQNFYERKDDCEINQSGGEPVCLI